MGGTGPDRCRVPTAFWRAMERGGLAPAAILRQARLPAALLRDEAATLPTGQFFALLRAVEEMADDPGLGLRLVEVADPSVLPPSVLVALYARDWRDALERLARFKRLCTPETLAITDEGRAVRVAVDWPHAPEGGVPALAADVTLAVILEVGRRGTGRRLRPLRVEVARPGPCSAAHRAYFGVEPQAGSGRDALLIDAADVDRPFLGRNREMLDLLTPALAAELQALDVAGSVMERVRAAVAERLASGPPDLDRLAADLGMSARTLQRRITEEGTSVREVLTEARRSLGRRLLADPTVPIEEVAFLLGYHDATSFYRAFRDWEGTTPGRWRERTTREDAPRPSNP